MAFLSGISITRKEVTDCLPLSGAKYNHETVLEKMVYSVNAIGTT
jgi:hypothetical protein